SPPAKRSQMISDHSRLRAKFLRQLDRALLRIAAAEQLRLLGLLRQVDLFDLLMRWLIDKLRGRSNFLNLFLLGGHDALQRGVAHLADALLNGLERRPRPPV